MVGSGEAWPSERDKAQAGAIGVVSSVSLVAGELGAASGEVSIAGISSHPALKTRDKIKTSETAKYLIFILSTTASIVASQ